MNTEITASQKSALLKLPGFKDIQKQYAKESKMEGGRRKRMKGRGFWDDVGAWFSQAGKDINKFLKDSKIVSNVAAYALPILGAMGGALLTVNPLGATAGGIAGKSTADYIKSQGYGKRKGNGILQDGLNIFAPLAGIALSQADALQKRLPKMRGGELVINPPGQRLMGKGMSFGFNGQPQKNTAPTHSGIMRNMKGKGKGKPAKMTGMGGTEYGSISSEFGNVQF